jgi:hypothetical protein
MGLGPAVVIISQIAVVLAQLSPETGFGGLPYVTNNEWAGFDDDIYHRNAGSYPATTDHSAEDYEYYGEKNTAHSAVSGYADGVSLDDGSPVPLELEMVVKAEHSRSDHRHNRYGPKSLRFSTAGVGFTVIAAVLAVAWRRQLPVQDDTHDTVVTPLPSSSDTGLDSLAYV